MIKAYRCFLKALSYHGVYPEIAKKHLKLLKDGKVVSSMSLTPGDPHVAIDHTLRHLIQQGNIPKVNRKNYISELKKAAK